MKRFGLICVALLTLSCASFRTTAKETLETINVAASASVQMTMGRIAEECDQVIQNCLSKGDETCMPLIQCQEKRAKLVEVYTKLFQAIKLAFIALPLADKDTLLKQIEELKGELAKALKEVK